jgi:glyoxylase-like metal-dependent hydrolase (beta-lactamase superfamily II)
MIKRLNFGLVNTYLIDGNNGAILVDTGYANNREKLLLYLKDIDLKLIILTHGHYDHVSNAKYISEKLSAPIAMHKADYELSKDNNINKIYADTMFGHLLKSASGMNLNTKIEQFTPQIFLQDGTDLSNYELPIKVLELKGHTAGSIGLLVGNDDIIVGDTIMNFIRPTSAIIYENKDDLIKSINIIKNTGAKTIYPGHGKPIDAKKYFND